ncbi:glycosyltransferase family 4 protein [Patescibacteria group bacterium]
MIIGVDGGALSITEDRLKVGVYKITLRFLENISQIDRNNYYRVYSFSKIGESGLFERSKIENRVVVPRFGWQKLWLPKELFLHTPDIFLGLSQFLPFDISDKIYKIGFIYDLGFIHHPEHYNQSANSLTKQTNKLVRSSDRIITISNTVKEDIAKIYDFPATKIHVCYPGVDEDFRSNGKKYQHKNPYFLFAGALKPGKNIPILLEAFAKLVNKYDLKHELLIAGGDLWKDEKIDDYIKNLKISKKVKLLGYVSDNQLAELYRGAEAFVNLSAWEGFGLPVAEAMASGCPVIVSDRGAHKEVIGKAGMTVDPEDAGGVCQVMKKITSNQLNEKFSSLGQAQSHKYSWQKFATSVLNIIKEVKKDEIDC